jgi:hypothetical protein
MNTKFKLGDFVRFDWGHDGGIIYVPTDYGIIIRMCTHENHPGEIFYIVKWFTDPYPKDYTKKNLILVD